MWRLFEENQQRADMLTIQYRMHAKICRWPSLRFYDGRLVTDPVVEAARKNVTPPCELLKRPRAFYNLPSEQEQPVVSYRNKLEAAYILAIVKHIRTVDRVNTIGVISFYSAQVLLLTYLLEKYLDKKTRVSTVDGFQGDECHYILLSCVRSQFSIGFLSDFRRLNVSITRPMCNLLVIGNLPFLVQKTSDLQVMIQDMIENGEVVEREELDQLLNLDSKTEVSKLLDAMAQFRISEERHVGTGDMVASQKNICFQYNGKPGSCHFGNRCKFLHQAKSSSGGQRGDQRGYHGGGGGGGGRKW
jgi:superfamily I DNA and/or RNA helicase